MRSDAPRRVEAGQEIQILVSVRLTCATDGHRLAVAAGAGLGAPGRRRVGGAARGSPAVGPDTRHGEHPVRRPAGARRPRDLRAGHGNGARGQEGRLSAVSDERPSRPRGKRWGLRTLGFLVLAAASLLVRSLMYSSGRHRPGAAHLHRADGRSRGGGGVQQSAACGPGTASRPPRGQTRRTPAGGRGASRPGCAGPTRQPLTEPAVMPRTK